ncbi:MAG: LuxR C-terminal-related transcriptional regulator [Muribaculaceae bacterium]|nr:LuxR C-terminal-related transcriptional regulator [Muribaculaceae bacterium]
MGYNDSKTSFLEANSSDEDIIYERIHPEDLVDKRLLEYEFFRFVDRCGPLEKKQFVARCRIRMRDSKGEYRLVDNTTQLASLSPSGKIWLILCTYSLSSESNFQAGIDPVIINTHTGEVRSPSLGDRRNQILTAREREVLLLIREGKPSKQIADILNISINTVNRHRQNILEKLSVSNSIEAVTAASLMKLI